MTPYYEHDGITIYHGDCAEILPLLDENSIDTCITDPPAGINFMNKEWDSDKGGRDKWVAWLSSIMCEILRILKPGGHALVWALPRTSHWTGWALEEAGFEIRDRIAFLFGCLSEDTEILTINGWERYHKNIVNDLVLCYNIDKDSFEFHKPIRSFIYDNKYSAYRIKSDFTDQIVSRNHRVLVERDGRQVFCWAEELQSEENIPFLESLYDLPETISNIYEGTSIKKQDLLKRVQWQKNITEQKGEITGQASRMDKNKLCILRERKGNPKEQEKIQPKKLLQLLLSGKGACKAFTSLLCKWQREKKTRNWIKGRKKSCMERWSNLFSQAWKLCAYKICTMSGRIFGYGTQGRLCYGTSLNNGSIFEQMFTEDRNSSSYRPQSDEQQIGEFTTFQNQWRTQKIRRTRATITKIEYKGNVWCVEVPTGAFVAKRKGKIFITGNSGFPKSLNIGKAVDKLQGNEREKVEYKYQSRIPNGRRGIGLSGNDNLQIIKQNGDTKGTSEWEGYGSALKPACEDWWLCRKPLEGTIAENCLKWGTGALNIDGCRIEILPRKTGTKATSNKPCGSGNSLMGSSKNRQAEWDLKTQGRYPANVIHDDSEEVLAEFPNTPGVGFYANPNDDCVKRSSSHGTVLANIHAKDNDVRRRCSKYSGDSGSASRFFYGAKARPNERGEGNNHPTVKSLALMEFLCRLTKSPFGGSVIDPFMGSGTTLIAAYNEGRPSIGIEISEEYCKTAIKRIKEHCQQLTINLDENFYV